MADRQVTCITTMPPILKQHENITHLGGQGWNLTRDQVISDIDNKVHTYFTLVDGQRADVRVVTTASGKYVRTLRDGTYNDNLLALPNC